MLIVRAKTLTSSFLKFPLTFYSLWLFADSEGGNDSTLSSTGFN